MFNLPNNFQAVALCVAALFATPLMAQQKQQKTATTQEKQPAPQERQRTTAPFLVQEKQRIAIFEPKEELFANEKSQVTPILKSIVWGAVEEGLVATDKYTFLDRSRLKQVQEEMKIQRDSDIYDQSTLTEIGKRAGASSICLTEIRKQSKEISIKVSIVNVTTGEILHSASEYLKTGNNEKIVKAVRSMMQRMMEQH